MLHLHFYTFACVNTAYLILGTNLGNRLHHLQQAIQFIEEETGTIPCSSHIYITEAWGNNSQPDFMNQAIQLQTSLPETELLERLLGIEKKMGRIRNPDQKWRERIIDIDILFYNNNILNTPALTIPHPYIQDRKFVLAPLYEIAPDYIHPVFHKSIKTLLKECRDTLDVKRHNG